MTKLYGGWQLVIGLEIHAQLNTQSKLFSFAPIEFGKAPNSQVSLVDLAMPGTLPRVNDEAINKALLFALAIGAKPPHFCQFDRKHYFYPDLPKGYQTTQLHHPICPRGQVEILDAEGKPKIIRIHHAHLEEDAGKSLHEEYQDYTAIDLNRAGTPLLEIVSEPDINTIEEASNYAKKVHALLEYLDICNADMSQGNFRCDVNVSLKKPEAKELGTRAEIKNLNSFRFLEKAIEYEIKRQMELLESGQKVIQETRLYNVTSGETRAMRGKEQAHDYRYFPCPDLLVVALDESRIQKIKAQMPELADEKAKRFQADLSLSEYDANLLCSDKSMALYFEQTLNEVQSTQSKAENAKLIANWILGEVSAKLNADELPISQSKVNSSNLANLISRISDQTLSSKLAKQVFEAMWQNGLSADAVIEEQGLKQITDTSEIEKIIAEVLANNPSQLEEYRSGKDKLFGFFVGQVMKASAGKANPAMINEILKQKLNEGQ